MVVRSTNCRNSTSLDIPRKARGKIPTGCVNAVSGLYSVVSETIVEYS